MSLSTSTVKTLFQSSPGTEPNEFSDTLDGSSYDPEMDELGDSCPYIRVGEHRVGVAHVTLDTAEAFPYNPQVDEPEEYRPHIRVGKHQVGVVQFPNGTGTYYNSLANIEGQHIHNPSEELDDRDDDENLAIAHVPEPSPITKENMEFLKAVEEEMMYFSALQNSTLQSSTAVGRHEYSAVTTFKLECSETACMFDKGSRASRVLSEIQQAQLNYRPTAPMNGGAKLEDTVKNQHEITSTSSEGGLQFGTVVRRQCNRQYRQTPCPEVRKRGHSTLGVPCQPISDESEDGSFRVRNYSDWGYPELVAVSSQLQVNDPTNRPWECRNPIRADSFEAATGDPKPKPVNEQGRDLFTFDRYKGLVRRSISPPKKINYRRQLSLPRTPSPSPSPSSSSAETDSPIYLKATRVTAGRTTEHRHVQAPSLSAAGLFRRSELLQAESDEDEVLRNTAVRRPRGGLFHVIETYDGRTNIGVPGTWLVEDSTLSSRHALVDAEATESAAHYHAQTLAQLENLQAGGRSIGSVPHYLQHWRDRTISSGAGIVSVVPPTYSGDARGPLATDTEVEAVQAVQENSYSDINQGEISRPALSPMEATRQANQPSRHRLRRYHFPTKAIKKFFRRFGKH